MNEKKQPMVVLTGPTAVGKTRISIELAKRLSGEIISADSMQVYRGMDIGTAKITKEEMRGVKHHLIDVLDPKEPFDVHRFLELSKAAAKEIYSRGHLPVVVGGTGFYIQALLYDIAFTNEDTDHAYRRKLEDKAKREGSLSLHEMLMKIDPASGEAIHPNNTKRIIRAIEYYHLTGERISEHNKIMRERRSPYDSYYFVLLTDRNRMYKTIDERVDEMLSMGLVSEVKRLRDMGVKRTDTSMQGIGYKQVFAYLEGEFSLDEAVYLIKRDTRHFAKRQLTWFRRERDVIWIDKDRFSSDEEIIQHIESRINNETLNRNTIL